MHSIRKLFFFSLLFSLLSFLPVSASQLMANSDPENKTNPRLNSMTPSIIYDFLVNDDTGSAMQMDPAISTDPFFGNIVITWDDNREFYPKIYAQRFDSSGARLGINFKVNDDTGTGWQFDPAIDTDFFGNFVIVWWDWDCGICGQRYSASGSRLGARFAANSYNPQGWVSYPAIAVDLFGYFIITWQEENYYYNSNIYAQLFDSSGTPLDSTFKVEYGLTSYANDPSIASDASGNLVITWIDKRADGTYQVYAQRFNSAGTPLGSNFKVSDLTVTSSQGSPAAAANWSGEFIITWEDYRNGHSDIYAQRFDSSGTRIGSDFKVNDGTGSTYQYSPAIAVDVQGSGSFVITWEDGRNGNADIYAQRYDSSASPVGDNYMVNDPQFASLAQTTPAIAVNGSKLLFTWMDTRRGNRDIYAKVVDWNWGTPHMVLDRGILNFIATQNGALPPSQTFIIYNNNGGTFSWTLSHRATWLNVSSDSGSGDSTIVTVNVNRTDSLPFANYDTIVVSSFNADNSPQMIPVNYYLSPPPSGPDPGIPDTVSVERMANVPPNAHLPPVHVYLANDEPLAAYTVPLAFPDSIYDYDIICDSISFAGTRTGPQVLGMYPVVDNNRNILFIPVILFASQLDPGNGPIAKIYFSTGPNWKTEYPVSINSIVWPGGLGVPPGIGLQCVDSSGQAWTPVFNAGALQVKESEPGTIPSHFELSQNYPNPFNPTTRIQFRVGSLEFGDPLNTTLKIYNILGQLVRTLVDVGKTPGKYEVIWDGKDDLGKEVASGIYFYQLKTEEYTATKKMVLLR